MDRTRDSLLEQLRDGRNDLAWREFLSIYWKPLYAFACGVGCSPGTAEEVTQETIVAVFENRLVFRYDPKRGKFRNWLFTVLRQKLALILRRKDRGVVDGVDPDKLRDTEPSPESQFELLFERGLLAAMLEMLRGRVEPSTYQAFQLTALQGLSADEAAQLTGLSRNAVYQARSHMLNRLRELGVSYKDEGQLSSQLKGLIDFCPARQIEQSLTRRLAGRLGVEAIDG